MGAAKRKASVAGAASRPAQQIVLQPEDILPQQRSGLSIEDFINKKNTMKCCKAAANRKDRILKDRKGSAEAASEIHQRLYGTAYDIEKALLTGDFEEIDPRFQRSQAFVQQNQAKTQGSPRSVDGGVRGSPLQMTASALPSAVTMAPVMGSPQLASVLPAAVTSSAGPSPYLAHSFHEMPRGVNDVHAHAMHHDASSPVMMQHPSPYLSHLGLYPNQPNQPSQATNVINPHSEPLSRAPFAMPNRSSHALETFNPGPHANAPHPFLSPPELVGMPGFAEPTESGIIMQPYQMCDAPHHHYLSDSPSLSPIASSSSVREATPSPVDPIFSPVLRRDSHPSTPSPLASVMTRCDSDRSHMAPAAYQNPGAQQDMDAGWRLPGRARVYSVPSAASHGFHALRPTPVAQQAWQVPAVGSAKNSPSLRPAGAPWGPGHRQMPLNSDAGVLQMPNINMFGVADQELGMMGPSFYPVPQGFSNIR